jgi:nucleoid DNA-binding protein
MATKKIVKKSKPVERDALELRPIKEKMSRTEIIEHLVEETELTRKQVLSVLNGLNNLVKASIMPKSVGQFTLPGVAVIKLRKIPAKKVPAIKKGTPVRNPFTGETSRHPGREAYVKPATVKVRVLPTAHLKRAALGTE